MITSVAHEQARGRNGPAHRRPIAAPRYYDYKCVGNIDASRNRIWTRIMQRLPNSESLLLGIFSTQPTVLPLLHVASRHHRHHQHHYPHPQVPSSLIPPSVNLSVCVSFCLSVLIDPPWVFWLSSHLLAHGPLSLVAPQSASYWPSTIGV